MKHPELLIPASSLEVLKTAVMFGADAVYIGGEAFGLRAKAKNFSMEEIREGIAFAHTHDVKVYITANILAHNGDLSGVRAYFEELKEIGYHIVIYPVGTVFSAAKAMEKYLNSLRDHHSCGQIIEDGMVTGFGEYNEMVGMGELTAMESRFKIDEYKKKLNQG